MKYKTAFRLAIRLIGVLLFFMQVPGLISATANVAGFIVFPEPATGSLWVRDPWSLRMHLPQLLGHVVGLPGGLYLFFRGSWIVDRAIPSNRPYCAECGYELSGLAEQSVCPECGMRSS